MPSCATEHRGLAFNMLALFSTLTTVQIKIDFSKSFPQVLYKKTLAVRHVTWSWASRLQLNMLYLCRVPLKVSGSDLSMTAFNYGVISAAAVYICIACFYCLWRWGGGGTLVLHSAENSAKILHSNMVTLVCPTQPHNSGVPVQSKWDGVAYGIYKNGVTSCSLLIIHHLPMKIFCNRYAAIFSMCCTF